MAEQLLCPLALPLTGLRLHAVAQLQLTFCDAHKYKIDDDTFDKSISAIAELMIESHIKCDASGNYALACAQTWASANSFAGASYEGALQHACL